mmetsp:Transcript_12811/g.31925  ORF Transcript_12811/g.31925 Transcript_12811/m.31925 type:complete len:306 (+) Transcript_12811:268-1185(+)
MGSNVGLRSAWRSKGSRASNNDRAGCRVLLPELVLGGAGRNSSRSTTPAGSDPYCCWLDVRRTDPLCRATTAPGRPEGTGALALGRGVIAAGWFASKLAASSTAQDRATACPDLVDARALEAMAAAGFPLAGVNLRIGVFTGGVWGTAPGTAPDATGGGMAGTPTRIPGALALGSAAHPASASAAPSPVSLSSALVSAARGTRTQASPSSQVIVEKSSEYLPENVASSWVKLTDWAFKSRLWRLYLAFTTMFSTAISSGPSPARHMPVSLSWTVEVSRTCSLEDKATMVATPEGSATAIMAKRPR